MTRPTAVSRYGARRSAERLRRAVHASAIPRTVLAKKLGVTGGALSHWINGRRECPLEMLTRVAAILSVDRGWLLGEPEGAAEKPSRPAEKEKSPMTGTASPEVGWYCRKAPPDGGRDFGNPNVFAVPPDVDTLARETGQN